MGNLHKYSRTVSCFVSCLRAAVLHILENLERIVNQFVALTPVDIYHHAHAAGIMFVSRGVEPLLVTWLHIEKELEVTT